MKSIILILLFFSVAFIQCDPKQQEGDDHAGHDHTGHEHAGHDQHEENSLQGLKLDEDKKWKSDASTFEGVQSIDLMVQAFNEQHDHNVEGYHQLSKDISGRLKQLFKECTMEGEAHDQLHIVVHAISEDAKSLSEVKDDQQGHQLVDQTSAHVNLFYEYFEKP